MPAIKTLELLIIRGLHAPDGYHEKIHAAFAQMLRHFSDEEFLRGIEHSEIITKIYIQNFYQYRSAEALSQVLHIDVKTLLSYRKAYLRLFAKFYLDLSVPSKTDLFFLYDRLSREQKPHGNSPALPSPKPRKTLPCYFSYLLKFFILTP